jgi:hypothetical protein
VKYTIHLESVDVPPYTNEDGIELEMSWIAEVRVDGMQDVCFRTSHPYAAGALDSLIPGIKELTAKAVNEHHL